MAKCFFPPEHIDAPEFNTNESYEFHQNKEVEFVATLRKYCQENSKCPDAGIIVGFPVADGQAQYMILQYSVLIWLQVGDRWEIPDAHMRGLRADDVKQMARVSRQRHKLSLHS